MSSEEKCRCFSPCNSSMHALNLKTFCGCEFCFLLRTGCIKEILILTFIPHSIKLLIEKCSNLTPALNTIRNRHYSTIGEFDKEDKFYQFCKESSPTVQSTDTLFASGSCTPTKVHFPYTDQMTFAPFPLPPQTHPRKKKEKKKGRKSIGRSLNTLSLL